MSKKIAFFLVIAIAISSLVALSLAWFSKGSIVPSGGEIIPGYFARGEGTKENPYVINKPIHLYNLAWLQDLGRFNNTFDENGNLVQYHFVVENDLDMSGYVLPPIGTRDYPFVGTFTSIDQTKPVTISNLTVSNVIDNNEISLRPASVSDITGAEIVGMFGIIGQYDGTPEDATYETIIPSVSYFNLNNPVIRTQTEKSLAGLIAGYVNGKLHEVGVLGGQIVSGANNTSGLTNNDISIYGLIGDHHEDVKWGGILSPDKYGSGGPLAVDANDSETRTALGTLANMPSNTTYPNIMVPESSDRAYFVGKNVRQSNFNGTKIKSVYFYRNLVTSGSDTSKNKSDHVKLNGDYSQNFLNGLGDYDFQLNDDLATLLAKPGGYAIATGTTAPTATNVQRITVKGEEKTIPNNSIWFKPESSGECIISFGVTQMSQNYSYKSIYRFTRDGNGNIINWEETKFTFIKGVHGNSDVVFFHFLITDEDIEAEAEYCIGSSTGAGDDTVLFYFLALAGTADDGGTVTSSSKEIMEVNFINTLPYEGSILGPDMKVTTFLVTIETAGKESYVTFSRDSMTVHASSSVSDDSIKSTKYEHQGIPPTNAQQNE